MLLTLRILAWRARRLMVLVVVVAAACLVARQAAPPGEPTRDVVVAARDLAAGDRLGPDDLRTVALPAALVPAGTAPAGDLAGREVTVDVPAGLPLVEGLLDGGRFGLDPPSGTVTVPVRLVDPAVAAMLRPGDHIDLVAPTDGLAVGAGSGDGDAGGSDGAPGVLAAGALVLDVITAEAADDEGPLDWTAAGTADPLVVVAVEAAEGHRLAAAGWGSLGAVLVEGS